MNKFSKNYKWRPLSKRRRFLKRPHSKKINSLFFFYRKKLNKNFRLQHWLRKHYLKDTLNLPYLAPHKEFSLTKYLTRLDFVVYDALFVRSHTQGRHFIRQGHFKVDNVIIKDPSFTVPFGSVITFNNQTHKNIYASSILNSKPYIYYGIKEETKQRLFPRYFKLKRQSLDWTVNLFNKR